MKKKSTSQSAFFNLRVLIGALFCLGALAVALVGAGVFAQTKGTRQSNRSSSGPAAPGTQRPDVVQLVGPVRTGKRLSELPHVPAQPKEVHEPLTRYPHSNTGAPPEISFSRFNALLGKIFRSVPNMPPPLLTFDGINEAEGQCGCVPPDTIGDVGPNHYVETTNIAIKVFDKDGNTIAGPTTFDQFFQGLANCDGLNNGDPFVFYDHLADRWVISDFAFPGGLPGNGPFFQCIGVSTSGDPAGTYTLYALQHEPSQPTWIGDYPKMAMWNSGGNPAQDAYFLTVNLFDGPTLAFKGTRTTALDRESMIAGGPANAIGFTAPLAGVGDSYSFVVAGFRTGDPPPTGRNAFVLAIDSPATGGVTLTQVHGRFFHVDFATPANSTFGQGANHTPDAEITVNGFIDAFTNGNGFTIVPQSQTLQLIDTLGDKIMTPVVYYNDGGTESLWSSNTVCTDANCTQPTGVRWYQFDVTGGTFPATPVQQQTWTNNNDGLHRFMSSIAVDNAGNTAIGYSVSKGDPSGIHPGIRYAGRLAGDPLNDLGQGEANMFTGLGSETDSLGRWGDYSMTTVDPSDGMTFFHANEYYPSNSSFNYRTAIGKFNFVGGGPSPTPTPTPSATPTPPPSPTPGETPTPRPRPTPHPRP